MGKKKETDSLKLYYSIGEVSRMLGVETPTIRYWEKEFDFYISPRKNAKGTRFYKTEDIERIRMIVYLRNEKGLGIEGIRKKLRENPKETTDNYEVISRLQHIRKEIQGIMKELE
ncbi:MAG: MerR family transcriptional regulator [Candidatus Azobacteroides sp.]|nr:MerR family transcriptional regulator [Candidatus Azobacteroides sp.]